MNLKDISNVWANMLNAWSTLSDRLVWYSRNGCSIKVGEDPFVGLVLFYKLSNEVIECLHQQGLFVLAQVSSGPEQGIEMQGWEKCE